MKDKLILEHTANFDMLMEGCRKNDTQSQNLLYKLFLGYTKEDDTAITRMATDEILHEMYSLLLNPKRLFWERYGPFVLYTLGLTLLVSSLALN